MGDYRMKDGKCVDYLKPDRDRPMGAPWTLRQAADYLGVSERHLARLEAAKLVRVIRLGRRVLVPDAEVQRLATEGV